MYPYDVIKSPKTKGYGIKSTERCKGLKPMIQWGLKALGNTSERAKHSNGKDEVPGPIPGEGSSEIKAFRG